MKCGKTPRPGSARHVTIHVTDDPDSALTKTKRCYDVITERRKRFSANLTIKPKTIASSPRLLWQRCILRHILTVRIDTRVWKGTTNGRHVRVASWRASELDMGSASSLGPATTRSDENYIQLHIYLSSSHRRAIKAL